MRIRLLLVGGGLAVALAVAACSGSEPTAEQVGDAAPSGGAKATSAQSAAVGLEPGTTSRDFESMDVCTVFPGDQLAAAVGAELGKEPQPTNLGKTYPACSYWLVYGGSTGAIGDVYILYLESPDHFDLSYPAMEDPQEIEGIADRAAINYRSDAEDYDLIALFEGDIVIEVIGEDQAMVQSVAEYVLQYLR
jgi:hypothetical protein